MKLGERRCVGIGGNIERTPKARYSLGSGFGHFSVIPSFGRGEHGLPTLLLPHPLSSHALASAPRPSHLTVFVSALSLLLHLIHGISWTSACAVMCWQIPSLKDSKRGHKDVSSSQISKAKSPPHCLRLSFGGVFTGQAEILSSLYREWSPLPELTPFPEPRNHFLSLWKTFSGLGVLQNDQSPSLGIWHHSRTKWQQ